MKYCESVYRTRRRPTREVKVGGVGIGGNNPLRIQSMTTSPTRDVDATVRQIMKLADSGCDLVRVTVQGIKEAEACESIKNELVRLGYEVPVVADIHFYPPAAMKVVDFVDKVRINPGNFVDRRASFKQLSYDEASYAEELQRLEETFLPLVEKCQRLKKALRLGVNHGSLSDRIMSRYGNTPAGMVESALEFAVVCRKVDFHDIVFSMKASNPLVMIEAYRRLVAKMYELGWDYPLHLGVTEAGAEEEGRIKSGMGMGALLLDGLGDTLRVSLTEDPWQEVVPCRQLISVAQSYEAAPGVAPFMERHRQPFACQRRAVAYPEGLNLTPEGSVVMAISSGQLKQPGWEGRIGLKKGPEGWQRSPRTVDALWLRDRPETVEVGGALKELRRLDIPVFCRERLEGTVPLRTLEEGPEGGCWAAQVAGGGPETWKQWLTNPPACVFLSFQENRLAACRRFIEWACEEGWAVPMFLHFAYAEGKEETTLRAAAEYGALLCDGLGEGICLEAEGQTLEDVRELSLGLLQAARRRAFKAEFISCPGCGRTLYNLQEVAGRIRRRMGHLAGVKIAIMGCIVNGPGEMSDADFGYVGSGTGKIDLYVGKECVERAIDFVDAEERLVALLKSHGRWCEPSEIKFCEEEKKT